MRKRNVPASAALQLQPLGRRVNGWDDWVSVDNDNGIRGYDFTTDGAASVLSIGSPTPCATNGNRSAWFVCVLLLMVYLIFALTLYLLPPGAR